MSARHIFGSDIPPNVPDGWREAANWHIDRTVDTGMVSRLKRILADARMVPFWQASDSAENPISHKRMLAVLVAGAYAPAENPGEIMERRRHLAERVNALAELIASDPDARQIDVEEVLHWTCPAFDPSQGEEEHEDGRRPQELGPFRKFKDADGKWRQRPALVTEQARRSGVAPTMSAALLAMADRLQSGKPIGAIDPLERAPWAQMREVSAATRLVRTLAAETEHIRDSIGFDLIAVAASVATGEDIDSSKARAIWRAYLRQKPEK